MVVCKEGLDYWQHTYMRVSFMRCSIASIMVWFTGMLVFFCLLKKPLSLYMDVSLAPHKAAISGGSRKRTKKRASYTTFLLPSSRDNSRFFNYSTYYEVNPLSIIPLQGLNYYDDYLLCHSLMTFHPPSLALLMRTKLARSQSNQHTRVFPLGKR